MPSCSTRSTRPATTTKRSRTASRRVSRSSRPLRAGKPGGPPATGGPRNCLRATNGVDRYGSCKRDSHPDREHQEHAEDHQRHGNGRCVEDAPGSGPDEGQPALCASDPQRRCPYRRCQPRVQARLHGRSRGQAGGLHRGLHRPRPVWRPERQPVQGRAQGCQGMARRGRGARLLCPGQQGRRLLPQLRGQPRRGEERPGESPEVEDLIGSVKVMLDAYDEGRLDRLFVVYNEFVNTMTQKPVVRQLLPLSPDMGMDTHDEENKRPGSWDYLYEPDAKALLDSLLVRFIESQVYQAVVENAACEQAARMIAMKNATDNAGGLIDDLEMVYNKARQAAITQEISEIVGGAAAV